MTLPPQSQWLLLSFSLPGRAVSTGRVRLWRALKDLGAGSLRDGVAVLPATAAARTAFERLATAIAADSGTTWLLELPMQASAVEQALTGLFDRTADYAALPRAMAGLADELPGLDEAGARRRQRQLDQSQAEIDTHVYPGSIWSTVTCRRWPVSSTGSNRQ